MPSFTAPPLVRNPAQNLVHGSGGMRRSRLPGDPAIALPERQCRMLTKSQESGGDRVRRARCRFECGRPAAMIHTTTLLHRLGGRTLYSLEMDIGREKSFTSHIFFAGGGLSACLSQRDALLQSTACVGAMTGLRLVCRGTRRSRASQGAGVGRRRRPKWIRSQRP
jgi:hypothetical protein